MQACKDVTIVDVHAIAQEEAKQVSEEKRRAAPERKEGLLAQPEYAMAEEVRRRSKAEEAARVSPTSAQAQVSCTLMYTRAHGRADDRGA